MALLYSIRCLLCNDEVVSTHVCMSGCYRNIIAKVMCVCIVISVNYNTYTHDNDKFNVVVPLSVMNITLYI